MPAETGCIERKAPRWFERLRSDSGSELIELALVLPVLLLFIFGFINFALIMFGVGNITFAARAAVRYACLHSSASMVPATTASITSIINPYLFQYPSNTQNIAVVYLYNGQNVVGSPVRVSITVTYQIQALGFNYNGLTVTSTEDGVIVQ